MGVENDSYVCDSFLDEQAQLQDDFVSVCAED